MKYLIGFELFLVAICTFVAWYVQSAFRSDALTIGLIAALVTMICDLLLIWIVFVIIFAKYLMMAFWRDSSMTEQT